jgi:ribose-phosphate pyrophosphokinase
LTHNFNLFSGNSNPALAQRVAEQLKATLGEALVSRFSDEESRIEILENVRGQDVFVIQSTSTPANDHLMELLLMVDALRRASAHRITAVIPYFGYARQDKRIRSARVPITAKLVADLLEKVKVDRVIMVDLHAEQIQGFFAMPVNNIYGSKLFIEDIKHKQYHNPLIVSPDVGGVVRARAFANRLNHADLAIIDKRRPEPNKVEIMNIIGEVKGRVCIILDDLIDTGGTLCLAAKALKEKGAQKILAYCTHPVLSGNAVNMINQSALDELVVTDTIPLSKEAESSSRIRQLSIAPMLAEVIRRVAGEESISALFN